jgi:putative hydrolase of HD superfamily
VIADAASDVLRGMVSWAWESAATHWPSVGIVIYDPAYWGQGLGYEALGLWSDYLFAAVPEFARLDLRTWSGNTGMQRLAAKLGYQEEARFRKARIVAGQYYDGLGYGVLREEWAARYPGGFAAHLERLAAR